MDPFTHSSKHAATTSSFILKEKEKAELTSSVTKKHTLTVPVVLSVRESWELHQSHLSLRTEAQRHL